MGTETFVAGSDGDGVPGGGVRARAAEAEPRPFRIPVRRRMSLRRRGARDGRLGLPDLEFSESPLTTEVRQGLGARFLDAAEGMWIAYLEQVTLAERRLAEIDQEIADLVAAQQVATTTLAELPVPDPANPVRRDGERDRSDEQVRLRRQREYDRDAGRLQARAEHAQAAIGKARARQDGIDAEAALLHRTTLARGERLLATFLRERGIYDGALLRRHPARDLVADALDPALPTLPAWWRAPRTALR